MTSANFWNQKQSQIYSERTINLRSKCQLICNCIEQFYSVSSCDYRFISAVSKSINEIIQNNFVSYNKRVDVWLVLIGYSHWRINICDFNNDFWIIFSDLNETFGKKNPGWGKWLKITQNYFFQLLLNLFYHWEKSRLKDYMNYNLVTAVSIDHLYQISSHLTISDFSSAYIHKSFPFFLTYFLISSFGSVF